MTKARTAQILTVTAVAMLGLGFASKPLYDTFCKVTGFGGTPGQAEENLSEVIDREVLVKFDSNVASGLPWDFVAQDKQLTVQVGASALAYYTVKNTSSSVVTGVANFNVTPVKAAPFFIKTECFCFEEQTIQPGEELPLPVLFFVDPQIDEDARLDDVREITLSYTFFEVDKPKTTKKTEVSVK
ncbi:MAG: cytochrome c oxidase assembly protein [Litorimonas sp.]